MLVIRGEIWWLDRTNKHEQFWQTFKMCLATYGKHYWSGQQFHESRGIQDGMVHQSNSPITDASNWRQEMMTGYNEHEQFPQKFKIYLVDTGQGWLMRPTQFHESKGLKSTEMTSQQDTTQDDQYCLSW